ncbi:uncharacterized protein LOC129265086 [Lytechinus pictus]|uniref:uncharacterized protein LOC129265086 n=1 Tax=Lytechinus pictus TaxID=7653 RepID=UPI0030B9F00F
MRKIKSRRSKSTTKTSPKSSLNANGPRLRSTKRIENVKTVVKKKVTKSKRKSQSVRGPSVSPDDHLEKREMHRIHERRRHYSLNQAIRKIINKLPSCEATEPETKHYVLRKTSDYIQFLEEKISALCLDLDIEQTNNCGDLSFSSSLYTLMDGIQKEIPADTPISLESIQDLLTRLDCQVDKSLTSLTTKKNSTKGKPRSMKATRKKKIKLIHQDGPKVTEIGDEYLQENDIKEDDEESLSTVNTQDSLLASSSMSGMMCSESSIETDVSQSNQMNSSVSSTWGTGSLDDGFSSSKTTDQESSQGSTSSISSHDRPQRGDSLADLIRSDTGVKYIPTLSEVNQKSKHIKWSQKTSLQQVVLQVPTFSPNQLSIPTNRTKDKQGPISFICHGDGNEVYNQADSTNFLPLKKSSCMSSDNIAHTPTVLFQPSSCSQYGHTQQNPVPMISPIKPLSDSTVPVSAQHNILNRNLVPTADPHPTIGYINCTLSNCLDDKLTGPNLGMSCTSVHPFEVYHKQSSLFQPLKQTVEIILDVGDDPLVMKSFLGEKIFSKRSGIDGFELFIKVNIKRFQDGWPALTSKEINRLIGQAWNEIPDHYKQLYGKRACAWNLRHKKRTKSKITL